MSRSGKKRGKRSKAGSSQGRGAPTDERGGGRTDSSGHSAGLRVRPIGAPGLRKGGGYRRLVLRFVGVLAGCMVVFNAWFFLSFAKSETFQSYLAINAEASAFVLRLFGEQATAVGLQVSSARYSVNIRRGCEAIQVSTFFIFAVLAWPLTLSWWRRGAGLVGGTILLLVLNLVRIVSLYYTGIYFPRAFETIHIDVWQPTFIVFALLIWVVWLSWASRSGLAGARHAEA